MMDKLLPCPYCGCEMELRRQTMCDGATIRYYPISTTQHKKGCQLEYAAYVGNPTTVIGATLKWNRRTQPENKPLTMDELKQMNSQPIWIEVLDRPDLSRWHFIVTAPDVGIIAKDGYGRFIDGEYCGCYFDIETGHNYGINWLAYRHKVERTENNE